MIIGGALLESEEFKRGFEGPSDELRHFKGLTLSQLEALISFGRDDASLIDTESDQNGSPTCWQFATFMRYWPGVTCVGYIVAESRGDGRVQIEGLDFDGIVSAELERALRKLCKGAEARPSEFNFDESTGFHVWWD